MTRGWSIEPRAPRQVKAPPDSLAFNEQKEDGSEETSETVSCCFLGKTLYRPGPPAAFKRP